MLTLQAREDVGDLLAIHRIADQYVVRRAALFAGGRSIGVMDRAW
ncbi:MAG: hypothetical protein ABIR62_08015 [Dokdonella sp.]